MPSVLDTTVNCAPLVGCLRRQGYDTVIRYYSHSAWKRIEQAEARALAIGGLRLAAVYQNRQNQAADFDRAKGEAAGRHACDYARNVIFQPPGSAIYFAVDFDASTAEVDQRVIPYFEGVRAAFAAMASDGAGDYRVGVYGSGRTCRLVSAAGVADLAWLAQATGWAEFGSFLDSGAWALKQNLPAVVCGIDCDPDETNPQISDLGAFVPDAQPLGPPAPAPAPARFVVNARSGLRLRAGPGTEFDIRGGLAFGTELTVLARSGDWALVDLNNDGAADGFCHAAFLRAA